MSTDSSLLVFGLCWFATSAAALEATSPIEGPARQTAYRDRPILAPRVWHPAGRQSGRGEHLGVGGSSMDAAPWNGRDWYSIDTLLGTITEPDMTGREKAFTVYELFKNNFYHCNVAECRRDEEGYLVSDVLDPVKMFLLREIP